MTANGKQAVKISREDLFRQVWETPMQRLAAEYGISGNGLAKICARLDIPCPPRGYWAKVAAGRKVAKFRLPDAKGDTPRSVTITPTPERPAEPAVQPESDEQRQRREGMLQEVSKITVPRTLDDPHPLVAKWIAAKPRDDGMFVSRKTRPYMSGLKPLEVRRYLILHTLFKEFDRRGFKIVNEWHERVHLIIGGERVEFWIEEHIRQVRRLVTAEDKKDRFYSGQTWRQERIATGNLRFKIKTYLAPHIVQEWTDKDDKPLEKQIGEIIGSFVLAEPILEARHREAAERERERREADMRDYRARQAKKRDDDRWECFLKLAGQWDRAKQARAFLAELEALPFSEQQIIGERSPADWLTWVRERLKTYDPLEYGAEAIWRTIAQN